jgi:hypothetical protein
MTIAHGIVTANNRCGVDIWNAGINLDINVNPAARRQAVKIHSKLYISSLGASSSVVG